MAARSGVKGRKSGDKSFAWTDDLTIKLLKICWTYQLKHGYQYPFMWHEIGNEFTSVKICHHNVPRNKFVHMKSVCKVWRAFWLNEYDHFPDPVTGFVLADDEWLEKKLAVNRRYKVFRKGGVTPKLSKLWNLVYSPMEGYPKLSDIVQYPASDFAKEVGSMEFDMEDIHMRGQSSDNDYKIVDHDNYEKLVSLKLGLEGHSRMSERTLIHSDKGKAPMALGVLKKGKMKKTLKKRACSYHGNDENIMSMEEHNNKLYELMDDLVSSGGCIVTQEARMLEDVMALLNDMVSQGFIVEESPLWCFSISRMKFEESRQVLLSLTKHSERVAWLKYEMEEHQLKKKMEKDM